MYTCYILTTVVPRSAIINPSVLAIGNSTPSFEHKNRGRTQSTTIILGLNFSDTYKSHRLSHTVPCIPSIHTAHPKPPAPYSLSISKPFPHTTYPKLPHHRIGILRTPKTHQLRKKPLTILLRNRTCSRTNTLCSSYLLVLQRCIT